MQNITIVIPAYNAQNTIRKTVEACLSQSYPKENIEIIVVDDGSTDNTSIIIKNFNVRYIRQANAGPAAARNLGWRSASGEIVFFTDADCIPEKDWINKLVPLFDQANIAAVGGTYDIANPGYIVAYSIHNEIQFRHSELPEFVRYLGSFNLAVKRQALIEVNGFDESFLTACGEDADLSYRLFDKGFKLRFFKHAKVAHFFPTILLKFLKQQFWRGFWLMKILKKHPGKLGKDDYSKLRDTLQPPLFLLIVMLTPFVFFVPIIFKLWLILNLLGLFLQTPVVIFSVKKTNNYKLLFLFLLLYIRGFFWALGCVWGIIKFRIL